MPARDLGVAPGIFRPGPLDAITDVAGMLVGHATVAAGGLSLPPRVRRRRLPRRASPVTRERRHVGSFEAVIEATEEALYNSMFMATSVTSRGRSVQAIPLDRVRAILRKYSIAKR